jgi:hypothetical protein
MYYAVLWFGFFVMLSVLDDRLGYPCREFSWPRS